MTSAVLFTCFAGAAAQSVSGKQFRLADEPLGSGLEGDVFSVEGENDFVVKIFHDAKWAKQEATALQALAHPPHPNVVQMVGYSFQNGRRVVESSNYPIVTGARGQSVLKLPGFNEKGEQVLRQSSVSNGIVLPRASGGSLDKFLANSSNHALLKQQFVSVVEQMLKGIQHIHSKNHVHGDVKDSNILAHVIQPSRGGAKIQPWIADFSLDDKATIFYMAPERFQPKISTPSIDVWSLGMTILDMLATLYCPHRPSYQNLAHYFTAIEPKVNYVDVLKRGGKDLQHFVDAGLKRFERTLLPKHPEIAKPLQILKMMLVANPNERATTAGLLEFIHSGEAIRRKPALNRISADDRIALEQMLARKQQHVANRTPAADLEQMLARKRQRVGRPVKQPREVARRRLVEHPFRGHPHRLMPRLLF